MQKANNNLFSLEEATGFQNNFEDPRLYPNPLHNKFTIEFPGKYQGIFAIQMVDLFGRKYNIGKVNLKTGGSLMDVDISTLSLKTGVYFLRIHSDESAKADIIKVIIE